MDTLTYLFDISLHLDKHLAEIAQNYGVWTNAILFVIVFCETGLVVTPFLPGDSLLFAAGALAAAGQLNVFFLAALLTVAAILGDAVNYSIGRRIGTRVFDWDSRFIRREHLERTQKFFERYGGKTIIIARFVPIVRTFAPFLAGVGEMTYARFAMFNVVGAFIWVYSLTFAGYLFSEIPIVKKNFGLVIVAIIIVSILPAVIEVVRAGREGRRERAAGAAVANSHHG